MRARLPRGSGLSAWCRSRSPTRSIRAPRSRPRELYHTATNGAYRKQPEEDSISIERGIAGFKGRINLHFSAPVDGDFLGPDELARRIDRDIVGNLVTYPTHRHARARLLGTDAGLGDSSTRAREAFLRDLGSCPPAHAPFFLRQYANQIENKEAVESA